MSSPAWNRRRAHQRSRTRTRKIRRLARRLHLLDWRVRWVSAAHRGPSLHAHGLAIDVNHRSTHA